MGDAVARVPADTFRDHIAQALALAVKAYNLPHYIRNPMKYETYQGPVPAQQTSD